MTPIDTEWETGYYMLERLQISNYPVVDYGLDEVANQVEEVLWDRIRNEIFWFLDRVLYDTD